MKGQRYPLSEILMGWLQISVIALVVLGFFVGIVWVADMLFGTSC